MRFVTQQRLARETVSASLMPTPVSYTHKRVKRRNRWVEATQSLVGPIASHYAACSPEPREDLRQVGLLGLIRAAELYNRRSAVPFEAYARQHIRGAILHYLRDLALPVRLPRRQQERQHQVRQLTQSLRHRLGREPNVADVRLAMGLSERQWYQLQTLPTKAECHAFDAIDPGTDAGEEGADADQVLAALQDLEPRQRSVVELVVLQGLSLRETARRQKSSASTVHRRLHQGLAQLRSRFRQPSLSDI